MQILQIQPDTPSQNPKVSIMRNATTGCPSREMNITISSRVLCKKGNDLKISRDSLVSSLLHQQFEDEYLMAGQ
jgi:hypothetical protein